MKYFNNSILPFKRKVLQGKDYVGLKTVISFWEMRDIIASTQFLIKNFKEKLYLLYLN